MHGPCMMKSLDVRWCMMTELNGGARVWWTMASGVGSDRREGAKGAGGQGGMGRVRWVGGCAC